MPCWIVPDPVRREQPDRCANAGRPSEPVKFSDHRKQLRRN